VKSLIATVFQNLPAFRGHLRDHRECTDRVLIRGAPAENLFAMSRTGQMGVQFVPSSQSTAKIPPNKRRAQSFTTHWNGAFGILLAFSVRNFNEQEDGHMFKAYRFLAMCTIGVAFATLSISSAQVYTTIDFPGAIATTLNGGPNPQGTSVGSYTDTSGVTHGFDLTSKGVFTSFDPPGSTATTPNWISPQGEIVGSYLDASNVSHGFTLTGSTYTTVDFPGAAGTVLTSLNPSGQMSGFSCVVASCLSGTFHSFLVSKSGVFTSFDPPGATSSTASTVIPSGAVVGAYTDSGGKGHGYLLYHGTYTTIDFPGSIFTFVGAANPEQQSVGLYTDTSNVSHSFLLSNGVFTSFDPPGAVFSDASGINPGGIIVGIYVDTANIVHGFVRTP